MNNSNNILLYTYASIGFQNIIKEFSYLGYNVDCIQFEYTDLNVDIEFSKHINKYLQEKTYEFIFSYNYFPVISEICNLMKIKYVCWIWDSPHLTLYSETVRNQCNYIFIFDKALYYDLKNQGIKQVYYLPLCSDIEALNSVTIEQSDDTKFKSDISFVGNLYDQNFYDQITYLPDHVKGYLEGIMQAQLKVYGYNFLEEVLTDEILFQIKKYVKFSLGEGYFAEEAMVFSSLFLGKKVTYMERIQVLEMLSRIWSVDLYTGSKTETLLPMISNKGYIDYNKEMPKVFKLSKINLNITLKTIKTGIPLRVFDIMGSGGFLLTNYQQELTDYFEPDKDFVYYDSMNDLMNKIDYYLCHEAKRIEIARNGYMKVREAHNLRIRLKTIIEVLTNETKSDICLL